VKTAPEISGAPAPVLSGPEARANAGPRLSRVIAGLAALLLFASLLNVTMGEPDVASAVPPRLVMRVIGLHLPIVSRYVTPLPDDLQYADSIVWNLRVPRALGGALIGVLLAMAGVAFQGLLLNPLADPYMVGVSAGSALGSAAIILAGAAGLLAGFAQPLVAFAAGLATTVVVYSLSRVRGRMSSQTFLLAGIVVGTFLWSMIPLMLSLAHSADRQGAILSQLLGNLQSVDWRSLGLLAPFSLIGALLLWTGRRELDLMAQGEETAAHLGVDTERFKRRVLIAGSLVTAAAVSVAGIIAFVGMVVPHIARRIVGPRHSSLLPTAMLLGGLVLVVSDWLSRVWLGQLEVGVITSLLGAPIFCLLLRRNMTGRS
jgi:iron complex transport system permease protein